MKNKSVVHMVITQLSLTFIDIWSDEKKSMEVGQVASYTYLVKIPVFLSFFSL